MYIERERRRIGKGFTLIELLIVIAIIAILTAILLPAFAAVRENARENTSMSNMHEISSALEQFKLDNGRYPTVLFAYVYKQYSNGMPVSMDKALDQADSDLAANNNSATVQAYVTASFAGLYPEYIKDWHVFLDQNNSNDDSYSLTTTLPVISVAPTGGIGTTPESFYECDAYDISPQVVGTNKLAPSGSSTDDYSNYIPRYQVGWTAIQSNLNCDTTPTSALCGTGTPPLNFYTRQLQWQIPPSDTYVTATTYHVPNADKVLVLWLSGNTTKLSSAAWLGVATDPSGTGEPATLTVNTTSGLPSYEFWKQTEP